MSSTPPLMTMRTAALIALALLGCGTSGSSSGSGSSPGTGAGSDASGRSGSATELDAAPLPQAFVKLVMNSSTASPGQCVGYPAETTLMQVGQPGVMLPPTRVPSGAQSVTIACSVHQQGDSFAINLQIAQGNLSSMGATTLTVSGTVNASTGGTNLTSDVSNTIAGDYHSPTCTISYSTPGAGASPQGPPVAPGRIWAHVSCPATENAGITTQSGGPSICDAEADFIFENCGL